MKTLKDVLFKRDNIISLAQEFGFDSEVRIFCDEPLKAEGEVSGLILIVKSIPEKSIHFESPIFLGTLLSEMLKCKVDVRDLNAITMYKEHAVRKSVPIKNENEIPALFNQASLEKIFFDDTKAPHPISLKNAQKHLASLRPGERKTSDAELLSKQAVVCEAETDAKKRKVGSSDEADSPNQGSTESPQKNIGFGSKDK